MLILFLELVFLTSLLQAASADPSCRRRLFLEGYPPWFHGVPRKHIDTLMRSYRESKDIKVGKHGTEPGTWMTQAKSRDVIGYLRTYKVKKGRLNRFHKF